MPLCSIAELQCRPNRRDVASQQTSMTFTKHLVKARLRLRRKRSRISQAICPSYALSALSERHRTQPSVGAIFRESKPVSIRVGTSQVSV